MIIGVYWGDRHQGIELCASSVASTLSLLGRSSESLINWYKNGASEGAREPIKIEPDALEKLLMRGVNKCDLDGRPIEDLGHSISMWNGKRYPFDVGVSITCDVRAKTQGVVNSCVVKLGHVYSLEWVRGQKIAEQLMHIWKAEVGKIFEVTVDSSGDIHETIFWENAGSTN